MAQGCDVQIEQIVDIQIIWRSIQSTTRIIWELYKKPIGIQKCASRNMCDRYSVLGYISLNILW